MNKAYRLIWSKAKERWIVAAEIVRGNGGPPPVTVAAAAVISAVLAFSATAAHALPVGGQVAAGQAVISTTSATQMNITQGTNQAIINWNSFGIGKGEAVNIAQPSASSTLLNRVLGNNPSEIFGSLTANGRVFLVNPGGVLFAPGASVNVGGLVASSLNIKDSDFLAGKYSFFKDGTVGAVVNQGNISGGFVALLGNSVENAGTIVTTKGSTGLAAGDEITLGFDPNGLMAIKVDKGAYNAQVANTGVIEANGGTVVMTAKAADALLGSVVNNSGIVRVQTMENRAGSIVLLADMEHGETIVSGTLDASAPNVGDGGFIETSAAKVTLKDNLVISAGSAIGTGGLWLIDPYDYTIGATEAGYIKGALDGGTSVTIDTTTSPTTVNGSTITGTSANGDITVASAITKTAGTDATLTLKAHRNITLDGSASITSTSNKLNLHLWADSDNSGDGIISVASTSIDTLGGFLKFGNNQTATINSVSTLVGGDVFFNGSALQTISTGVGSVDVYGETIIGNTSGVTLNSTDGNITFHGLLNSGNQYTFIDKSSVGETESWDVARTEAKNGTGGGSAVNDSYLVTITSRLENAIAGKAAGYTGAWLGAWRPDETNGVWTWADGPEAGKQFFTQTTNGTGGTTSTGYYSNFGTGEPNGSMTASPAERVGQFYGTAGGWNDLNMGTPFNQLASDEQYKVHGYVRETNLAASPLTISANGVGSVTFSGAVGSNKALASLNVYAGVDDIYINGGAVTTTGAQTYNGNISLGSSSTVLTQTAADTNFTLPSGKNISTASGDVSLTIKTTGNINIGSGSRIFSPASKLNTVLWADSDASGSGAISLMANSWIETNGGHLWMGGGAASGTPWNGLNVGNGSAVSTTGDGIKLTSSWISSGSGNIYMNGKSTSNNIYSDGIEIDYPNTTAIESTTGSITLVGTGGNAGSGLNIDGSIRSNTGAISLTGYSSGGTFSAIAQESSSISSTSGNISLNANTFWMDELVGSIESTGTLTIAPTTAGRTIGISGGTGDLSLDAEYFNTAGKGFVDGFSGITIGSATAGAINVGDLSVNDDLTLKTNSTIAINNDLFVNMNLTLQSAGAITQTAGRIVSNTTTIDAGANDVTLTSANNTFGTVSVLHAKNLSLFNINHLHLRNITATGTVDIAANSNLVLQGAITTSNATADAIKLNAGKSAAAGTAAGEDIDVSGGSINLTGGGSARATLFTGNVANAGLTTLVGSGTNRFRYNSDETSTNYTTPLGAGIYVIHREQPIVTTTATADSTTYSGVAYSGGNGVTSSGLVNGDTSAIFGGALAYGGTSQGAVNVGSYNITPSGYNSGFGYALAYADGTLTINKAHLTVTADNQSRLYGAANPTLTTTVSGFVNGEDATVLSGAGSATTTATTATNVGMAVITAGAGTLSAANYDFTTLADGTLTIDKAHLIVDPEIRTIV
jgi:filamentous hemagglutinin family protein